MKMGGDFHAIIARDEDWQEEEGGPQWGWRYAETRRGSARVWLGPGHGPATARPHGRGERIDSVGQSARRPPTAADGPLIAEPLPLRRVGRGIRVGCGRGTNAMARSLGLSCGHSLLYSGFTFTSQMFAIF